MMSSCKSLIFHMLAFFRRKANDILMIPPSLFSHLHHRTKWEANLFYFSCFFSSFSIRCWSDLLWGWSEHSFISNKIRSTKKHVLTSIKKCRRHPSMDCLRFIGEEFFLERVNRIFISSNQLMKYSFDISVTTSIRNTLLLYVNLRSMYNIAGTQHEIVF